MNESLAVRRVLVPTDFSSHATAAVRYAAPLAARFGARVALIHVAALHPPFEPLPESPGSFIQTHSEHDRLVIAALEKTRAEHLAGVDTTLQMVFGHPAEAILETSRSWPIDLVVMGTRGRGRLTRTLLGSVAQDVIRGSERPVLTVRRTGGEDVPGGIRRILCPMDDSTAAARAFAHALLFASAFEAELHALDLRDGAYEGDLDAEAERLRLRLGDVPLPVRLICLARRGDPVTQVVRYAWSRRIDLVVAGATTDALARNAPCPVLTVPPRTGATSAVAVPPSAHVHVQERS